MKQHRSVVALAHGPERLEHRIGRVEARTPRVEIQAFESHPGESVFQLVRRFAVERIDRGKPPKAVRREGDELRNFLVAHQSLAHLS